MRVNRRWNEENSMRERPIQGEEKLWMGKNKHFQANSSRKLIKNQ